MKNVKPAVMIIGTGAVGTALATSLSVAHYSIHSIVSRNKHRAELLASRVGASFAFSYADLKPTEADIIFFCIPDDVINTTAKQLADNGIWKDKIVAHTSGALAADALQPLARQGAFLMSFHPVQTFANNANSSFSDIYIGIEGGDEAIAAGISMAHDLGAQSLVLSARHKPSYHLAATIASNYLVTLIGMACDVLESIGTDREEAVALLRPLVMQTCTNVTTSLPEDALTGPASRGDAETLQMHMNAIQQNIPRYTSLYQNLLSETLDLATKNNRLSKSEVEDLKNKLLRKRT